MAAMLSRIAYQKVEAEPAHPDWKKNYRRRSWKRIAYQYEMQVPILERDDRFLFAPAKCKVKLEKPTSRKSEAK